MASVQDLIERAREQRRQMVGALASPPDDQITAPVEGGGDVRSCLWRLLVSAHQCRVQLAGTLAALGWRQSEAQRILALTMESRGDLRAILGVPDECMDIEPAPGEWSVRQALEHAHLVDERYTRACLQAVDRLGNNIPPDAPADGQPRPEPEQLPGRVADVLARLQRRRNEVIERLSSLSDEELAAPIVYRGEQVNVAHRMHLISAHEREHIGQVARTLRAVGFEQSESEMILGQVAAAAGVLQGIVIGLPDDLVGRTTSNGESVERTLARAVDEEAALFDRIRGAVAV